MLSHNEMQMSTQVHRHTHHLQRKFISCLILAIAPCPSEYEMSGVYYIVLLPY